MRLQQKELRRTINKIMKLKLVESKLFEEFDPSFELSYDAEELVVDTDDEDKYVYGTVDVDINNVFQDLWEFIDQDENKDEIISDEQLNIFAEDDKAWKKWVEENYIMLLDRYIDEFEEAYFEIAQNKLYSNWDDHCDKKPFDQYDDDMRGYYDLVAQGLKLR